MQIAAEYFHPINDGPGGVANEIRNVVAYISRQCRATVTATVSQVVKCQRDRDASFCRERVAIQSVENPREKRGIVVDLLPSFSVNRERNVFL